jgi:hypothetical protein
VNLEQVSNAVDQVLTTNNLLRDADGTEYILLRKGKKNNVALMVS